MHALLKQNATAAGNTAPEECHSLLTEALERDVPQIETTGKTGKHHFGNWTSRGSHSLSSFLSIVLYTIVHLI